MNEMLKSKSLYLLISLIVIIIVYPLFEIDFIRGSFEFAFFYTITTAIIIYSLGINKITLDTLIIIGLPAIILTWVLAFFPIENLIIVTLFLIILFYLLATIVVLNSIIKSIHNNSDTIFRAVSGYILIGLTFVPVFTLLNFINPGSFVNVLGSSVPLDWLDFFYYSFVTLNNLGYGEIVPRDPIARTAAIIASTMGTIYIAVLIARLIGINVANQVYRDVKLKRKREN